MSDGADRLYNLLPVIYRQRDLEKGEPLRALLRVIGEQHQLLEGDIAHLYENWFIETCDDWVVPYIADLIGYRQVHEAGEPGDVKTREERSLNKILTGRREVANTIRYRRQKGTLALLEVLAEAVAGWPARVVEFDRYIAATQSANHPHPRRGQTVDLRAGNALDRLGTPFDALGHSVDVRRTSSLHAVGRYNLPGVGLFVYPFKSCSVTHAPAYCLEDVASHCYTFSILGNDTPLLVKPVPEPCPTHIADELNLPTRIRRRDFEERSGHGRGRQSHASEKYYGEDKSLAIWAGNWAGNDPKEPIPATKIIPADLSDWGYRPRTGHLAVDPELGRMAFPSNQLPEQGVWVSYHYGFGAELGGGEYKRKLLPLTGRTIYYVGSKAEFHRIHDAYAHWLKERGQHPHAIIEITDSGAYEEQIHIELAEHQSLELRAGNGAHPVILLLDWRANRPDSLTVTGEQGSRFCLDGLLITGRGIELKGKLDEFRMRHSTLVPGWALQRDNRPRHGSEPSLALWNVSSRLHIDHSILGPIQIVREQRGHDPIEVRLHDCILDATRADKPVLSAPECSLAPATLTIERCTVFGEVHTHAIALADNCIFTGNVQVARRQVGCMRFCYVLPDSRTPRRYECQPDLVNAAVIELANKEKLTSQQRDALLESEQLRIVPEFSGSRYGMPNYAWLAQSCADEILRGADDRSEMGVFHDLFRPQRTANLLARLEEYTPAGMDPGIICAEE
jgi:hypothetical protein